MEEIINKLVPLSAGKRFKKPYEKKDKPSEKQKKLSKALNKYKTLRDNENIAMCLYWIGKEAADKKFAQRNGYHILSLGKALYALCKGNKSWINHFGRITLSDWRKINIRQALQMRNRVKRVLDGARTNVGEDVNPNHNSNVLQQNHVPHDNQVTRPNNGDLNEDTGISELSYDLEEALQTIGHPHEDEDSWPSWEDLTGNMENMPEYLGITENAPET